MPDLGRTLAILKAGLGVLSGGKAFGGPIQANVDVTNRCNVRCIHCYFHSPLLTHPNLPETRISRAAGGPLPDPAFLRSRLGIQADSARVHATIDELLRMGTRAFQFSGNGEVFTHPEAMEFIGRAKSSGATCVMNTNATLLDSDKIDSLVDMQFDELRISLLAGTREAYMRTHPGTHEEMFDRIRDSLLRLAERKRSIGSRRPKVCLVMVIMSANVDDMLSIARFAEEVRADKVIYRILDDVNDPALVCLALTKEQDARVKHDLREAARFLDARGIGHNIRNVLQVLHTQLDTTDLYHVIPCYYGWMTSRIDTSGDVRFCCRCPASVGNVTERGFGPIWHGEAYAQLRRQAITLNRRGAPVSGCDCYSCPHHNANLRAYKAMHPLAWRLKRAALDRHAGDEEPD